ncbi:hypothetical protein DH2020_033474 [Rehmannia glutinosa]|uniref:Wall-associated receptor kinase galacturonan-binding domain-containing protein n=1 Tax=Rehmannia glutinosa TaxID=99300 RepID=A0ABR0VEP4_REHGL
MASSNNSSTLFHFSSVSSLFSLFTLHLLSLTEAKTSQCRTSCGQIPINYPFGIDDGCGSPYYRHILICSDSEQLELRTPSGRYAIRNVSYTDPHIIVTDPLMWSCQDGNDFRPTRPFSLDTSTHFKLSPQNDYLFFNCSETDVIMESKPMFCGVFPSSVIPRVTPPVISAGSESLRMMLRHCATYTSVYWRNLGITPAYNQVPEYGIRVDFDIPVTTRCLWCHCVRTVRRVGGPAGSIRKHKISCACVRREMSPLLAKV